MQLLCHKLKLVLFILCAGLRLALPATASELNEWSYPENKSIWHEALGPHNDDALAMIEGRPFAFRSSQTKRSRQYENALPVLEEAARLAAPHVRENPEDVVHCYVNLGVFHFLRREYAEADRYLATAQKVARTHSNSDSLIVAEVLEYRAMVQRALGGQRYDLEASKTHYENADKSYKRIAKIKANSFSESHPDIEHTARHRLMSLRDAGELAPPSTAQNAQVKTLTPSMMSLHGQDSLAKMVSFANQMIAKYKSETPLQEDGLASIIGNWAAAQDLSVTVEHKTKEQRKEIAGDIDEVRSGFGSQKSNVSDVPIFLCRVSDYSSLTGAVNAYGQTRGLAMKDFPRTWPVTHQQAEDLLLQVQRTAESVAVTQQKTDKDGGFDFQRIPKGRYFLFASLVTKDSCRMWFKFKDASDGDLTVTKVQQFEVNFAENDGVVAWSRTRRTSSRPPAASRLIAPPPPGTVNSTVLNQIDQLRQRHGN